MKNLIAAALCVLHFATCYSPKKETVKGTHVKPNIVFIYADVGAYAATELKTPNMDNLANWGIRFTNGYGSSATPSRYALLRGVDPRREKGVRILSGNAPLLIGTN